MTSQCDLWTICEVEYFPLNLRIGSIDTTRQYRFALNDFAESLGKTGTIDDLTDDNLTRMSRHLLRVRRLAPCTVNERVGRIKSLWTWLAKRGEVRTWPTVTRITEPEPTPFAWTIEELRQLFAAAESMPGWVGSVRASEWWPALLLWVWCTGERKEASLCLEHRHVNHRTKIATVPASIRKRKVKHAIYPLWDEVCERIRAIKQADRVFHWPHCSATYYNHYSRLLELAGLQDGRDRKTHSIRVSYATWITVSGGDATRALLHDSPTVTKRHYIDQRHMPRVTPNLPRLGKRA